MTACSLVLPGACGSDLMQAQPSSESGSQGDDEGVAPPTSGPTTLDTGEPQPTTASPTGSGDDGTTDPATSEPGTTQGSSDSGTSTTDPGTGSDGSSTTTTASGCRSDLDCTRPAGVCDTASGECVGCLPGDDTCDAGTWCDPDLLDCVPGCDDDDDCGAQVCDERIHACVECVDADDCPTGVCTDAACVTLGYDCLGNSSNCNAGEQCCGAQQCSGSCMIPCSPSDPCPSGMGCEHGWCLFPCDNDDADCAQWPGFTCEHGGSWCES